MARGFFEAVLCASVALWGCGDSAGGADGLPGMASCVAAQEPFGAEPDQGLSFPDVTLTDCEFEKVSFDELRCDAEITLLSIGAGWCEPCREETPQLQAIHESLQAQGVRVVQVLIEDSQTNPANTLFCSAWVDEFALTLPVFIDPVGATKEAFDNPVLPLNVVVDAEGRVLWSQTGIIPEGLEDILVGLLPT